MTAEEVRQKYIELMGAELGDVYYALYNEVMWLHARWQEYTDLFAGGPDRLKLLNAAAPFLFRLIQDDFLWATLLHLCRLTDPPEMGKKEKFLLASPGNFWHEHSERASKPRPELIKAAMSALLAIRTSFSASLKVPPKSDATPMAL